MQFSQTIERKPGSLIQSQSEFSKRDEGPISSPKETERKQFSDFHFGNIPILAGDKIIQPKLTINQLGDQYEREADAMADKVIRMTQPEPQTASTIQRKCAKCEAEEKKKKLQRKENNPNSPTVSTGLENYTNSLHSHGQPLSKETRNFFEPRFGYDFGHVRIHNDGMAAESAQSIQARAYTQGSHIVFNRGEFRPHSEDGKRLLGHELTHVVQQKESKTKNRNEVHREPKPQEKKEENTEEKEWQEVLKRVKTGNINDSDIKNKRLMNWLTGRKTAQTLALINSIETFHSHPEKKQISTKKIIQWLKARTTIATPMPENATVSYSLIPADEIEQYSISLNDIEITILSDNYSSNGNNTTVTTNFDREYKYETDKNKVITKFKMNDRDYNPTKLEVTIQTNFRQSLDTTSAYGKGTTEDDKKNETTTLRVHEGQHGLDYIKYLTDNPLPVSLKNGIINQITTTQLKKLTDYVHKISSESCELTDQIGNSQDEYLKTKEGKESGIVSCRKKR